MTVEAIQASGGSSLYAAAATKKPEQTMNSDMFMKMLVIQLKNQDPTSPMDTNAMIGQTTQLAMMEKTTELATNSSEDLSLQMRSSAAALIGRHASYEDADGTTISGEVSAVSFSGAAPTVTIGGKPVDLASLTSVSNS
jgi:flagellar basal-body rod modification protein FlgD